MSYPVATLRDEPRRLREGVTGSMLLRTAYVRFYRSFNFDYLRKRHRDATPDPWDLMEDGAFYPYVSIDIDPELTCVVGANESGKSQLLKVIECGLGEAEPGAADFCRHSTYFTVVGAMKLPHFGLHFVDLSEAESAAVAEFAKLADTVRVQSFRLFRKRQGEVTLYLEDGSTHDISDLSALGELLPTAFSINPDRAIPNSVPISYLADGGRRGSAEPGPARTDRWALLDPVVDNATALFGQLGDADSFATTIKQFVTGVVAPSGLSDREEQAHREQLELAFDLLVTVGGIDEAAFVELQAALRNDDEGLANGIVAAMNDQLARSLNLAKWWSQDQRFNLAIAVRDFDIVFTIGDRTGSEYSFAERSGGLKYFLSYLVQLLAHIEARSDSEILLMDEPDAYLSNQGQQDLLRVFQHFTEPHGDAPGGQVVFVTHSPFLIDKNRADRIRVLDKGSGDEGARVVRDVGHNHFEPLRTALGGFVGETAFIGNCNLMLEGITDQVYLAGMSAILKREGFASTECLDLNRLTLVPAGSASHVPYMTYLARGRDADQPAVIVLLDGDAEGNRAVKALQKGGAHGKQLLRPEYITQLKPGSIPGVESERPDGPLDIEDLVPVEIGLDAARRYLAEMEMEAPSPFPTASAIRQSLSKNVGVLNAIQAALDGAGADLRLEKLGFARHAVAAAAEGDVTAAAGEMWKRFAALFSYLTKMQREAERERARESVGARVEREKSSFLRDHKSTPTRAEVAILLERIESAIDESVEGDALVVDIRRIREELDLDQNLNELVADFDVLKARLEALQYAPLLASQPEAQQAPLAGD